MLWQLCSVEIWRAVYICTMFVKLRLWILSPQSFSIVLFFSRDSGAGTCKITGRKSPV